MLSLKDRGKRRKEGGVPPRPLRATLVSFAVHLVLVFGLWQALQFPRALGFLLDTSDRQERREERLQFLVVQPSKPVSAQVRGVPTATPLRPPAVGQDVQPPAAPAPIVAPTEVPTGVPAAPAGPAVPLGPATGPLASGRGPAQGVQPAYSEPRIWVEAPLVVAPALEGEAKLDSAVAATIYAFRDSMAANTYQPNKFERQDWTYTTKDGKKYGIDKQFIRLGKVSIPTALLGLLPLNQVQGNPIAMDRERRLAAMRSEIIEQAQMAMNEEEFRRTVKQIRERKERERKEAEKKKKKDEVKVISEGGRG